jgi:hypothetical protein
MKITRKIIFCFVLFALSFSISAEKKQKKDDSWTWQKYKVEKKDSICFALYTVQNHIMKMLVQLYPLSDSDSRKISLSIEKDGKWEKIAETNIRTDSYAMKDGAKAWNALFRVENWDSSKEWKYKVTALDGVAEYTGVIKHDPLDKSEIVVAAFTGNSHRDRSLKPDIIKNIKAINPDLLFFSGDQSYDHTLHLSAWLLFGRQFGDIIRNCPTVCLPDDHDVGQGNLWGENGKKASSQSGNDGGYYWPVKYVNEVEFAQTSFLPDPYDPTPIKRGIGVHYTSLNVGGISFAIIEDRKFKSGPNGLVETPGHKRVDLIGDPGYDRKAIDVPEAKLLGERQLKFLHQWGQDWKNAEMKCVLSPTIFCQACTKTGPWVVVGDLDSNGWPQTGRDKALCEIRRSFAFMIAGDQHLATIVHQGVNEWNDSGYSFCVPSIVNHWPRTWAPKEKPHKKLNSPFEFAGEYYDGFGNKITMISYANPWRQREKYGEKDKGSAGFGIVRFNKKNRTITMECWPRGVDVTQPGKYKQFPGWPFTVTQYDNYGREATAWLPLIKCINMKNPVIQVINEQPCEDEIVYTIRINGSEWQPKVFQQGLYTIKVGGQGAGKQHIFKHIKSSKTKDAEPLVVK